MQEVDKGGAQLVDITVVGRHVIGIDVGHYRKHRLQVHERGITLIRFSHQIITLAEPRVRISAFEASANDKGRVEAALCEHPCDQTRGRRLAMRAGNGNRIAEPH